MEQLLLHLIGDYVTQSDWMAMNKSKKFWPAWVHAYVYAIPFMLLTYNSGRRGEIAWFIIFFSHLIIDRFALARYIVWAKNWLGGSQSWTLPEMDGSGQVLNRIWIGRQPTPPWRFCRATGYPPGRPEWLAVWLVIVADNTLHLAINYASLRWL